MRNVNGFSLDAGSSDGLGNIFKQIGKVFVTSVTPWKLFKNGQKTCKADISKTADIKSIGVPAQYLKPMSKTSIDAFIEGEKKKGCASVYFLKECDTGYDGTATPCFLMVLELERYNLYYLNGLIPYDNPYKNSLMYRYEEIKKTLEKIPSFPKAKDTLKKFGAMIVKGVVAFVGGGPVGFFLYMGKETADAVNAERLKKGIFANKVANVQQSVNNIQTALNERERLRQVQASADFLKSLPLLVGSVAVGGLLIFFGDDIKKFANKKL